MNVDYYTVLGVLIAAAAFIMSALHILYGIKRNREQDEVNSKQGALNEAHAKIQTELNNKLIQVTEFELKQQEEVIQANKLTQKLMLEADFACKIEFSTKMQIGITFKNTGNHDASNLGFSYLTFTDKVSLNGIEALSAHKMSVNGEPAVVVVDLNTKDDSHRQFELYWNDGREGTQSKRFIYDLYALPAPKPLHDF